jgi:hypothetical protein
MPLEVVDIRPHFAEEWLVFDHIFRSKPEDGINSTTLRQSGGCFSTTCPGRGGWVSTTRHVYWAFYGADWLKLYHVFKNSGRVSSRFLKYVVDFLPPQTIWRRKCSLFDHKSGSRWSKSEQRGRNRMQLISIDGYILHNWGNMAERVVDCLPLFRKKW